MAVKKLPPAGRAPRTAGHVRPPVQPGATAHIPTALGRAKTAAYGTQPAPVAAPDPQGSPGS